MSTVALIFALYGAVVSTYLGYLTWRRDRHRVRASAFSIFLLDNPEVYPERSDGLVIEIINQGHRPVTVTAIKFVDASGDTMYPPPIRLKTPGTELPAKLLDSERLAVQYAIAPNYGTISRVEVNTTSRVLSIELAEVTRLHLGPAR